MIPNKLLVFKYLVAHCFFDVPYCDLLFPKHGSVLNSIDTSFRRHGNGQILGSVPYYSLCTDGVRRFKL